VTLDVTKEVFSQISQRCLYKSILAGEQAFDENRWMRDHFVELHDDDFLWANVCREAKVFKNTLDEETMKDTVLWRLIRLGLYDWDGKTDIQLNQATQAIRHGTGMMMRFVRFLEA
jgi:hypothetical protein